MEVKNMDFNSLYATSLTFLTAECTAEEAFSVLGDNIIFASGSPFSNVDLGISL